MPNILIELHYLPTIPWFEAYCNSEEVTIETGEFYNKQTFRNRTLILGANRVETLVIPVLHNGSKQIITDVKIDNSQRWAINHWRTISSAYGKSPFFAYYSDGFKRLILSEPHSLFEFNNNLLTYCLKCLGIGPKHGFSSAWKYNELLQANGIEDVRNSIEPSKNCVESDIKIYHQVFGPKFVGNLSILDLLFCCGPEASDFIVKTV